MRVMMLRIMKIMKIMTTCGSLGSSIIQGLIPSLHLKAPKNIFLSFLFLSLFFFHPSFLSFLFPFFHLFLFLIEDKYIHILEKELGIANPSDWYRVSYENIRNVGITDSQIRKITFSKILPSVYPDHSWDMAKLQLSGAKMATQRWVKLLLKKYILFFSSLYSLFSFLFLLFPILFLFFSHLFSISNFCKKIIATTSSV